jgi:hypothetical protein
VDWSQVARLESKQLFIVKAEDGSVYRGTLNTVDTPAGCRWLTVTEGS